MNGKGKRLSRCFQASISYGGIIRIRFIGYNLSRKSAAPLRCGKYTLYSPNNTYKTFFLSQEIWQKQWRLQRGMKCHGKDIHTLPFFKQGFDPIVCLIIYELCKLSLHSGCAIQYAIVSGIILARTRLEASHTALERIELRQILSAIHHFSTHQRDVISEANRLRADNQSWANKLPNLYRQAIRKFHWLSICTV